MPDHEPDTESTRLMRAFADDGDDAAFGELVARYSGLVFGAASRRCGGRAALAEEVAQEVFADFAKRLQAGRFRIGAGAGAWLHRSATLRAGDFMKRERRREAREAKAAARAEFERLPGADAWAELSPQIDTALAGLREADQRALVLRYLEGRGTVEVAAALGVGESAAQKRLERALGRLRERLRKRGVVVGVGLLGTTLAERADGASVAVPAGFADGVLAKLAAAGTGGAWAWFSARWAGAGAAAALVSGGVPLVAGGAREDEARESQVVGTGAEVLAGEAVSVAPPAPALPYGEGLSFEEVVAALGELHARPMTQLDRKRVGILLGKVPQQRAGEALSLSERTWSAEARDRADGVTGSAQFESFRHYWCSDWGRSQPEAALRFAVARVRIGAEARRNPMAWGRTAGRVAALWSAADRAAAVAWLRSESEAGRLDAMPAASLTAQIMGGIASAYPAWRAEPGAVRSTFDLLCDLNGGGASSVFRDAVGGLAAGFVSGADLEHAIERVRSEMGDVHQRIALQEQLMRRWREVDWDGALAWVEARANAGEAAQLGWALGFPDPMGAGFDAPAHAERLWSLRPAATMRERERITREVVSGWMPQRPGEAVDFLLANAFSEQDAMVGIVAELSAGRPEADGEWRAAAVRLLRGIDPETRGRAEDWRAFATDSGGELEVLHELITEAEGGSE